MSARENRAPVLPGARIRTEVRELRSVEADYREASAGERAEGKHFETADIEANSRRKKAGGIHRHFEDSDKTDQVGAAGLKVLLPEVQEGVSTQLGNRRNDCQDLGIVWTREGTRREVQRVPGEDPRVKGRIRAPEEVDIHPERPEP